MYIFLKSRFIFMCSHIAVTNQISTLTLRDLFVYICRTNAQDILVKNYSLKSELLLGQQSLLPLDISGGKYVARRNEGTLPVSDACFLK